MKNQLDLEKLESDLMLELERLANDHIDAVNKLYKHRSVTIYNTSANMLEHHIVDVYKEIKKRNNGISDINKQMLPTNPYRYTEDNNGVTVYCAEISMEEVEVYAGTLSLLCGYDYSVLAIQI